MSDKAIRLTAPPEGYADWFVELKVRIHGARQRAALAVNRELVVLYWQIGRDILARQALQGWGSKVIDRLSQDLRAAFPEMKGFSSRNLKYMRAFAEAWPDDQFVQQAVAQLPWGHNVVLLDKLPSPETRRWYAAKAIENNWSRNVLVMQIESRLFDRSGKAVTNFPATLPGPQSDLARESLKDPYRFDILGLTEDGGFGVERNDKTLFVHATPQTFAHKHDLVQAMLAVNDMFALAGPTVTSLFIEDVATWLEQNDVRSVPRVKLAGRSGYDHTFDFVIPKFRHAPERIVQAINTPSKNAAEALMFKWVDTRDSRDLDSAAYALLNDQEQSIPAGVLEALESYDINAVRWSERDKVVEALAA